MHWILGCLVDFEGVSLRFCGSSSIWVEVFVMFLLICLYVCLQVEPSVFMLGLVGTLVCFIEFVSALVVCLFVCFMFGVFLVLSKVHLFPHTRVCGLSRGGCSNFFVCC